MKRPIVIMMLIISLLCFIVVHLIQTIFKQWEYIHFLFVLTNDMSWMLFIIDGLLFTGIILQIISIHALIKLELINK